MKHHFVPEIYLKQFSKNCEGHFFKVKRGQKKAKKIHTSGVCYREDFYDIKDPKALQEHKLTEKSFLEYYGFPYERGWVALIENFKSSRYVSRSQHEQLLKAYVSIKQRTNFFRKQFTDQKLLNRVFNAVTSEMYEEHKTLIDQRKVDFESMKNEQLEKMQDTSAFSEENHLRGLIESFQGINSPINDALLKLLSMNFEVLTPKVDKDFFLTSDNPGFSLDCEKIWNTNFGRFDTVVFPIASKYVVLFQGFNNLNHLDVLKRVRHRKIDTDEVNLINYASLCASEELLFCENETFLNDFLKKENFPLVPAK